MQGSVQWVACRRVCFWIAVNTLLHGCSGSGVPVTANSDSASVAATSGSPTVNPGAPASPSPPATSVAPIAIQGTPSTSAVVGSAYVFQPTASQSGSTVLFSITNQPAWAYFNTDTGGLAGIPSVSNVGTTRNVTITVSNGASSAAVGPFDVTVTAAGSAPVSPPISPPVSPPVTPPVSPPSAGGSATLAWQAPTQNTDGSPLTNLAGYHVYYGTSTTALTVRIAVPGAASTGYVVNGLTQGTTYYFAVTAYNVQGVESAQSNVASKSL